MEIYKLWLFNHILHSSSWMYVKSNMVSKCMIGNPIEVEIINIVLLNEHNTIVKQNNDFYNLEH